MTTRTIRIDMFENITMIGLRAYVGAADTVG
jgi:hypothetical protein